MIRIREGQVLRVTRDAGAVMELVAACEGGEARALAYPDLTGPVEPGQRVLLNTTAVAMNLGSGGAHFVMAVLDGGALDPPDAPGHIMKMNYTPLQCRVLSAEEPDSPHHDALAGVPHLGGMPVIVGTLHSMAAPVCAALRELGGPDLRIAYIMSDAACLPLAFSRTVSNLKEKELLCGTITYGQAFGGDLNTVNKFSALMAARTVLRADVAVVTMGVGVVGTNTALGHGAMEQGEITNAAARLGGAPVAVLRIGFADKRPRHNGVSHHTLTALSVSAIERVIVPVPELPDEKAAMVRGQLEAAGITARHSVQTHEGGAAIGALKKHDLRVTTMGRGPDDDPEFFLSCGAAARAACELIS